MLHLIGLGLRDGKDISLRGKELVDKASAVYLEGYTSLLACSHEDLEKQLGTSITVLSREDVEQKIEPVLVRAKTEEIVILIIGDPYAATTHDDMTLRAKKLGVEVNILHNASIISAIGETGLELYRFGKTVSIPYWEKGFEPTSFHDGIEKNLYVGLHTLCLLDIKVDEDRFMSVPEGIEHLQKAGKHLGKEILPDVIVGIARLGFPDAIIVSGSPENLLPIDFGKPPHCIVIPGKLSDMEKEFLEYHSKGVK